MLRLRSCVLTHLLSSPPAYLHRLLSTAAPVPPRSGFAVEDYLVATCGLTRAQALKASTKLSHLKSPSKPDAVLAFLAGLGLPGADVAALVAKDPQFLCAHTEKTLASNVAGLTGLGLSRSEIARLVPLAPHRFRGRSIDSKLRYFLLLFGSFDNFLRPLKRSASLLGSDLERIVKPNVAFLQECGLCASDVAKLVPRILSTKPERVRAMVACAQGLGVPCRSAMFRFMLHAVAFRSKEQISDKVEHLKDTLGWSDAEVATAVCKAPSLLTGSKDKIQRVSQFLISEVGLHPGEIAHRPVYLTLSLEARLRPRLYVIKFLKENGLLKHHRSYYTAVVVSGRNFIKKYICPHKKAAPYLAADYDAACRGEAPANFRITIAKNGDYEKC